MKNPQAIKEACGLYKSKYRISRFSYLDAAIEVAARRPNESALA